MATHNSMHVNTQMRLPRRLLSQLRQQNIRHPFLTDHGMQAISREAVSTCCQNSTPPRWPLHGAREWSLVPLHQPGKEACYRFGVRALGPTACLAPQASVA